MEKNETTKVSSPGSSRADFCIPVLALALSWLFWFFFRPPSHVLAWPYSGVLVYTLAHFACVLLVLEKRTVWSRESIFLLTASLVLALSCALWSSFVPFVLNCFLILLTAAMATFSLAGQWHCTSWKSLFRTIPLSLLALFTKVDRPFRAGKRLLSKSPQKILFTAASLLAALFILGLVLWLLASADAVFGSFFRSIHISISPVPFWSAVRVLLTGLLIASALYFIREPAPSKEEKRPLSPEKLTVPLLIITILLNIVYVLFCLIQIRYLFGGASAAAMAGGWAEYARSGFFQLVAVAAINLAVCLPGIHKSCFQSSGGKLLRIMYAILLFFTAFILVSAFRRMQLYMDVYGLSLLRLEVLWAIAVIALGILTALWKLIRPEFPFFRTAAAAALLLWCILSLSGPGRIIANYNVDQYLSGNLKQVDIIYLENFTTDALPALQRLREQSPEDRENADRAIQFLTEELPAKFPWFCYSLSSFRAIR